jgi:sec-independent protein translocase protein TatC
METLKVAAYAGLLLSLPLILYQIYAFVLPAFSPRERQIAVPAMLGVPFLFIGGVVFGYFMVLPPAIRFLQNFNTDSFDVLIQAQPYYKFVIMLLAAMGLLFQIPVGILALTRVGIVSTRQLSKNRRYAVLVIAVIAMVLPGQDPVTMTMMMVPMYVLFEGSILISWLMDRRERRRAAAEEESADAGDDDSSPREHEYATLDQD